MSLINTPPCSKILDKLKNLSIQILKKYSEVDKSESCNECNTYYYTSSDDESAEEMLTKFEKMSNEFNIGVISRLNHIQASVVLAIFKALFDNNFWIYDKNSGAFLFADFELSESDLSKLYESYDVDAWINVLEKYVSEQFDDIDVLDENTSIYGSTYISSIMPSKKDDHQYMTIDGIIKKYE